MSENINDPQINVREIVGNLELCQVEVIQLDPRNLEEASGQFVADLNKATGGDYISRPGTIRSYMLPEKAGDEEEVTGFIVTEGTGIVEMVSGRRNAQRIEVQPGSVVLVNASDNIRYTTWIRTAEDNEGSIGVEHLVSGNMRAGESLDSGIQHSFGARGRRASGEYMAKIAGKKEKALQSGHVVVRKLGDHQL